MKQIDLVESYGRARRVAWEKLCGARAGSGGYSLPFMDARHCAHARIVSRLIDGYRRAISKRNHSLR